MKRIFTILAAVLLTAGVFAQSPEKMSYQAVIRDDGDALIANTDIGMQISIRQGTPDGTAVYTETHTPTTNANGLVILEIGTGTTSDKFSLIDWSAGPYFIKTETDPDGGTDYTITGTSQLLSVPYTLYAKTAAAYTETDPKVGANTENYLSKWDGTALVTSTIFDNGNIGIGTNDPSKMLEISKSSGSGTQIDLIDLNSQDDGSGSGSKIRFRTSNNSNTLARIGVIDENLFGGAIQFEVNQAGEASDETTEVMRINKLGHVGIGTVTPSTLLDVNGVITATGANFTGTTTVPTPVDPTDAATKAYVDALIARTEVLATGFTDSRDGNHYDAVKIGDQIWLAENLAYLPEVHSNAEFETQGNNSQPGYGVYGYDGSDIATAKSQANYSTYGVLYNWWAAMDGAGSSSSNPSGVQGVCPTGWHLPSDAEWTELENYLIANGYNYDGTTSGNKIAKSMATSTGWTSSTNIGAVGNTDYPDKRNASGFSALPGGYRGDHGNFGNAGNNLTWYSATENSTDYVMIRSIYCIYSYVDRYKSKVAYGYSVRCLRD